MEEKEARWRRRRRSGGKVGREVVGWHSDDVEDRREKGKAVEQDNGVCGSFGVECCSVHLRGNI